MASLPLVTIGLAVYNGIPYLEECLRALLSQDYPNLEIIISDNASQDGTAELCRRLTADRAHVRYVLQPRNVGPTANFRFVLDEAAGQYFMFAAHDDYWNERFVSRLVARLQEQPAAALATPAIIHISSEGAMLGDALDRPAPGMSAIGNLKVLLQDHAASWIYGVYNTQWLREHFDELHEYPGWGCDMLWLADVTLRYPLVGSQEAILFKRLRKSGLAPRSSRAVLYFWAYLLWFFTKICWRRTSDWQSRVQTLAMSWRYVYKIGIKRPTLLSTLWRVCRVTLLATISLIPLAVFAAWRRIQQSRTNRPQDAENCRAENQVMEPPSLTIHCPSATGISQHTSQSDADASRLYRKPA